MGIGIRRLLDELPEDVKDNYELKYNEDRIDDVFDEPIEFRHPSDNSFVIRNGQVKGVDVAKFTVTIELNIDGHEFNILILRRDNYEFNISF